MAERRMFAKTIIDSDAFLDLPMSARLLYYDLAMRADDDGFTNSPKKIMRMIGAAQNDLELLAIRKFIIPFENGIVVIKHWKIHNYIRKDTYSETQYSEQKAQLFTDKNNVYVLKNSYVNEPSTVRQRVVDEPSTQVSIGKVIDRLGKDRDILSGKPDDIQPEIPSPEKKDKHTDKRKEVIDYLNCKLGTKYTYTSKANNQHINARLDEGHTVEDFKIVIDKKIKAWKSDPKMRSYLRPETLFGTKFDGYLNELEKIETYGEIKNRVDDPTTDAFGHPVDPVTGDVTENGIVLFNIRDNDTYGLYCDFRANTRQGDVSLEAWEECRKAYFERGELPKWK